MPSLILIMFFDFWRRCAARRQKSNKMPSLILNIFFDFWRRCAARRQKSKKMPSLIFSLIFSLNKRHSCRRFPHVRKKKYAKKKSRSDFFLASTVARHSSLGRIDRHKKMYNSKPSCQDGAPSCQDEHALSPTRPLCFPEKMLKLMLYRWF